MKRIATLFAAMAVVLGLNAQTPLTTAPNFTATDIHGHNVDLYQILDGGQHVLIDFFYTTCGPCQSATPKVIEAYQRTGCNLHDIFFMEVALGETNASATEWVEHYGVEYPTIAGNAGTSICQQYGIPAYPTVIVIAPNRQIVRNDIYPLSSSQLIINNLTPFGIQEHDCTAPSTDPEVAITVGDVTATTVTASFQPSAACASYWILLSAAGEMETWAGMMGATLEQLVQMWGLEKTAAETYTWDEQTPGTAYTVYALPIGADGQPGALATAEVETAAAGGAGEALVDIQVEVIDAATVRTIATPNDQVAEYHYGLITAARYDELGAEAAAELFRADGYPLYEADDFTWIFDIEPETDYYALGTAKNADGAWGATTLVPFTTPAAVGVDAPAAAAELYPNPASDVLNIAAAGLRQVEIYNDLGQLVATHTANGGQLSISTASLPAGIYLARVNGQSAHRFVVRH